MITKCKKNITDFFLVLLFAAAAIVVHAVMPSPGAAMDTSVFDSFLVKKFGFPAVASGYFLVLFLHILFTIRIFAVRSDIGKWRTGCCFGAAFALIYMGGMQEVMVSASPLTEYGLDFILYQLFLGLGDAVPAFLLCVILCRLHCVSSADVPDRRIFCKDNFIRILCIAAAFFVWRMIGYFTGIVDNEMSSYPVPVVIWTFVFGILLGIGYCLVNHIFPEKDRKKKQIVRFLVIIGVNWIWFNCFIGLILADSFFFMFMRAGTDVLAMLIGGFLAEFLCRD